MPWSDRVGVAETAGLLSAHRIPRMRTADCNKPSALNPVSTSAGVAVARILGALGPIIKDKGRQKFSSRLSGAGEGRAPVASLQGASRWPSSEPAFERVAAHVSCARCLGVVTSVSVRKCGELIALIERQDGAESIELFGELRHIALVPR
ncbi:hypothetical protein HX898_25330 [Rhizobium sp. WYCCWR 11128]|nr:hypothetical protein [Rhizobium sp. WYCCWR 11128]